MSTVVEQEVAPLAPALETAIALETQDPRAQDTLVWGHLRGANVLVLGRMGSDQQIAEVLYFTTPGPNGRREDVIPVFTRLAFVRQAVQRNPDWHRYEPVTVSGGDLMEA